MNSHRFGLLVSAAIVALVFSTSVRAGFRDDPPVVAYDPVIQQIQGQIAFSQSYPLTITSPNNLPDGVPVTVTLTKATNGLPVGQDEAVALSYVTFSSDQLTFTGPSQSQTVQVTMNVPVGALPGAYGYQINSVGWPDDPTVTNDGSGINGNCTLLPVLPEPPTVTVQSPAEGAILHVPYTGMPMVIPFEYTASAPVGSVVSSVDGDVDGMPLDVTLITGLNTSSVDVVGNMTLTTVGSHTLSAHATNSAGTADDQNTFTVVVDAPPPTVAIGTPTNGQTFTYKFNATVFNVPLTFTGTSGAPLISIVGMSALLDPTLDGNGVVVAGTGTLVAIPGFNPAAAVTIPTSMALTTPGNHLVVVTASDEFGQEASTSTTFNIALVSPTPTIAITTPTEGQSFQIPTGGTSTNVPFSFATTSNNGFVVDTVSATLNGNAVTLATVGAGTALATSTGTFANLAPGAYTFTANGSSAGIPVTQTIHFTVKAAQPPPSVVINTPAPNATFTKYTNGPALTIPMTFTGTSNFTNGVITGVTATLDGVPLTFVPVVGTKVVNNSASMIVSAAGTHTIKVTATDAVGTATATQTFTVVVNPGYTLSGTVFFDVDTDGTFDAAEFGLLGTTVTLRSQSGQVLATTTSGADGKYSFAGLTPGTYSISATAPAGLAATNGVSRTGVVSNANVTGVNIGFMIDFCALQGKCANGFTIGYWKNNVDKAISGKTNGVQVSAATIKCYTKAIGSLALSPYDNITLKTASSVMSSTSSAPKDLLSKQLLASEYNYENKAYLNGNGTFTFLFIWWGEYVLKNSSSYSSSYILWAKNWFDAYNNTHGGAICGPALSGTSCTGGTGGNGGGCGGSYSGGWSDDSWGSCNNYGSSGSSWSCSNNWYSRCGW